MKTSPIVDDLLDLFPDEVLITPGTRNSFGEFNATGPAVIRKAHVFGQIRQTRSQWDGLMKTTTITAILAGDFSTLVSARFTLPSRFVPNQPIAVAVAKHTDDNGPHHETVYF
jgi:hypothetical protein